ncbi:hypothetical protein SAMN03159407_3189 [Rhizobium sp. NFR12]|nr:hypothetical protein SAMN03159407_3189 [Rhizobium sp. NFR12]
MKYSAYLATGLVGILVLTGISTANAQMMGAKPLSRGDVQLVQKQQGKQHMLKGHRGMKERRQGYRRHSDGYWYRPQHSRLRLQRKSQADRTKLRHRSENSRRERGSWALILRPSTR